MKKSLVFGIGGLALLLAFTAPSPGQGKDKKSDKDNRATPDEYKQIQKAKELEGKVGAIDTGSKLLTLQLGYPHMEPNPYFKPGQPNPLQKIYNQLVRIMQTPNPIERQRLMNRLMAQVKNLQNGNSGPYRTVYSFKEFELPMTDKVVVRKMVVGVDYDKEGNIIQYTKAHLAKLRGNDPKVPGYEAKMDDLKSGQFVHLFLNPAKVEKTEEKSEGVGNVARPAVRMIVILQEPKDSTVTSTGKKKN